MKNHKEIQKELLNNKKIEKCALQFGITGDKTRMKICYILCNNLELSVSEISKIIRSPISTVSRSLKKLKEAEVVVKRRDSKTALYSFKDNDFVSMLKKQLAT